MVSLRQVEEQLRHVGCNYKIWGRSEIRELCNVLMPDEIIAQAVNGSYEGGFAMLCVTNHRVLLIDRKPMLLTIEDIRYDMMSEVDYQNRFLGASVRIFTLNRDLVFTSWSGLRMRKCVNYIQQRVLELRQHPIDPTRVQYQYGMQGNQFGPQGLPGSVGNQFAGQPNGMPRPTNPYTKTPMLTRRRRFPSFY